MAILRDHLAGLPDCKEPWNQTDTGRQWLEKATAAQRREEAADGAEAKPEASRM
jgi:hypothetical protein